MTKLYCVQATVCEVSPGGASSCTAGVPTFFLDADVQGIVSAAHAAEIAERICNPASLPSLSVHIAVSSCFGRDYATRG